MALDDFEKELFNDLEDYQSPLNLDQEWQELEERFPKKKKRRFLIWWLPVLAIILMVASVLFYNNTNTISKIDSKTVTSNKSDVSKQIPNTSPTPQSHKVNTSRLATKNNTFTKKTISKTKTPSFISKNNSETIVQSSTSQNQNHTISQNQIPKQPQSISNVNQPIKNITSLKSNTSLFTLPSTFSFFKITNEALEIPTDYYLKYITPIPPKDIEQDDKKKIKGSWSMAFGYTYGSNQFKRKSSMADLQQQIDFLSNYEKQVDYMSFQLKIYNNLNKHFSLFSGIRIDQHTSLFQLGESFEVERNNPSVLLEEHYLLSGLVQNIYGEANTQYDVTIQSKLWQKYQSIGIPLGLSIHSSFDKKWSIQNDLAIMIHPFQNAKGSKIIKTETDYFIFDNNSYTSKIFTSLANQFILNYKITNHFSLQLSGDLGMDLSSRLNTGEQYDLRFSHIGVGLGGKFLF